MDDTITTKGSALSQKVNSTQSHDSITLQGKELDKKVNELVQYMLVMDQKKIPIKKKDINKTIMADSKTFPVIMARASEKLSDVFGFKVVELEDKMKGSYILVNEVSHRDKPSLLDWSEEDRAKMGLLSVILNIIFMNGNQIDEDDLWNALKRLGLSQEEKHATFGNVRNLVMDEFVRQAYLEAVPQPTTDPPIKSIIWGQRAKHELTKSAALNIVCQITDTKSTDWPNQEQQVQLENGPDSSQPQTVQANMSSKQGASQSQTNCVSSRPGTSQSQTNGVSGRQGTSQSQTSGFSGRPGTSQSQTNGVSSKQRASQSQTSGASSRHN